MENNLFINESINYAINGYLNYKNDTNNKWNFLIYVMQVLTYIYNEADIINPYITKEDNVFKKNMLKYGVSDKAIYKLFKDMDGFLKIERENFNKNTRKNIFFTYTQEDLIDLFIAKYKNLEMKDSELDNFQKLIFSNNSGSKFQRKVNELMEVNNNEALNYFENKIFEIQNVLSFDKIQRNVLDEDVYELFGMSGDKINTLNSDDLNTINKSILNYFKLSPIEPNLNDKVLQETIRFRKNAKMYSYGKINIYLFLVVIVLVIIIGFYLGYKMIGW